MYKNRLKIISCLLAMIMVLSTGCAVIRPIRSSFPELSRVEITPGKHTKSLPEHINAYDIDMRFNEDNTLDCLQKTTYVNNTGDTLESLFFHAYPNAYQHEEKTFFDEDELPRAYPNGFSPGSLDMNGITGKTVKGYEMQQDDQLIEILLHEPLAPKESAEMEFQYTVTIPNGAHRFGYNDGSYNIANFYPIACVYDGNGWAKDNYCGTGDPFYSDTSNYEVSITLPKGMTLANTGEEKEVIPVEGVEKHIISAPLVRDFAFCFSKKFKVATAQADGTKVLSFYRGRNGQKAADVAADAIQIFNRLFGKYDYPVFSVVDTNFFIGGMEYPNLVMIDGWMYNASSTESLEYVIAHETAHQWWYSMIGNDQIREAWLDEGLTEYSTLLYFREKYGDAVYGSMYRDQIALYEALGGAYENDPPMGKPITGFADNMEYQMLAYTKPTIMYHELRLEMGDKKFFESLRTYFFNNRYCIATVSDLVAAFEQTTNLPWAQKIKRWVVGGSQQKSTPEPEPQKKGDLAA